MENGKYNDILLSGTLPICDNVKLVWRPAYFKHFIL